MQRPAYLPLKANRFTDFSATLVFHGVDLIGKVVQGQVRLSPNDSTGPVITLQGNPDPIGTGLRYLNFGPETRLAIFIKKADIATLGGTDDDADLYLSWDLQVVDAVGTSDVLAYGPFVLRAGVTR